MIITFKDLVDLKKKYADFEEEAIELAKKVYLSRYNNDNGQPGVKSPHRFRDPGDFRYTDVNDDESVTVHFEDYCCGDYDYNEVQFPFSYFVNDEWEVEDMAQNRIKFKLSKDKHEEEQRVKDEAIKKRVEEQEKLELQRLKQKYETN